MGIRSGEKRGVQPGEKRGYGQVKRGGMAR